MAPKQKKTPKAEAKAEVAKKEAPKKAEEKEAVPAETPPAEKPKEPSVAAPVEEAKKDPTPEAAKAAAPEEEKKEAAPENAGEPATPAAPEKPKEAEEDAAADTRAKVKAVGINHADSTCNALPTADGKFLMALSDGGFQYLLAGVRADAGLKAGRYMFESKIVEMLKTREPNGNGKSPQPRNLFRIGLTLAGNSTLLTDSSGCVHFDSEGFYYNGQTRKKVGPKVNRGQIVALVVNCQSGHANANTVSLFVGGVRASEPQPLPEDWSGKVFYPSITYRRLTLQINFGPVPQAPLPFKCHMLADAAAADVEVTKVPGPKDGKYHVLYPVGLPEQGYFDWVDDFLEKNPGYTELSDRKLIEWAVKSGVEHEVRRQTSNDRPVMGSGLPLMDDMSMRKTLALVAPTLRRNYIIPELRANLIAVDRANSLEKFNSAHFKKSAVVIMGEPTKEYKEMAQSRMLAEKRAKTEAVRRRKGLELERKRALDEKRRKSEEVKKKMLPQRKGENDEELEVKEEEKVEEKQEEEAVAMEDEAVVELTEEEKALWFRKLDAPDLSEQSFAKAFVNFSVPKKEEGFDEVNFRWQKEAACAKMLNDLIMEKKQTQRVDDLQPGEQFKEKMQKWHKAYGEWKRIQLEWKDPAKRKQILAKKKEAVQAEAKKEAEAKGEDGEAKEGEAKEAEATEAEAKDSEAKGGEAKDGEAKDGEAKEDPMEIDMEDLDVFSVEDVTDCGNGEPLFANFLHEDWMLLSARFEFNLLLHSFRKDLNDPDRQSFVEAHVMFYYQKYFKKAFNLKQYGVENMAGLAELICDVLAINEKTGFLEAKLEDEASFAYFIQLSEKDRRERQRRLDAGDETARLRFPRATQNPPRQPQTQWVSPWASGQQQQQHPQQLQQKRPAPAGAQGQPPAKQARAQYGRGRW